MAIAPVNQDLVSILERHLSEYHNHKKTTISYRENIPFIKRGIAQSVDEYLSSHPSLMNTELQDSLRSVITSLGIDHPVYNYVLLYCGPSGNSYLRGLASFQYLSLLKASCLAVASEIPAGSEAQIDFTEMVKRRAKGHFTRPDNSLIYFKNEKEMVQFLKPKLRVTKRVIHWEYSPP